MNSGNATVTNITGTVTLNTNTTVRGLQINSTTSTGMNDPVAAITGVNVSEVSVTTTTGTGVDLSSTVGTLTFTGLTTTGGTGANLIGTNTGATFNFSGVVVSSGANAAFTATGGGTVNVTGATNTLTTTTATALNVANTTIGASGLTFLSINAPTASANPGIVLNNTGTGAFTVTGTGTTAGTGGTISNKTGNGIDLRTASNVTLKNMNLTNNAQTNGDNTPPLIAVLRVRRAPTSTVPRTLISAANRKTAGFCKVLRFSLQYPTRPKADGVAVTVHVEAHRAAALVDAVERRRHCGRPVDRDKVSVAVGESMRGCPWRRCRHPRSHPVR